MQGLDVPEPWAAGYRRSRGFYRASLLMRAIEHAETLAQRLAHAPEAIDWRVVGAAIARMHAAKLWHADLNAHNILFDRAQRVWIVDFDKAEVRAPSDTWRRANLARLKRSLLKLGAQHQVTRFEYTFASELCAAHAQHLERTAS
jgi:3-deoxy-D-manno-octulosonic acid kinase